MHRKKGTPIAFFIVFAIAIGLAAATFYLPIPSAYRMPVFFITIPVVAFIGVFIVSLISKKRR